MSCIFDPAIFDPNIFDTLCGPPPPGPMGSVPDKSWEPCPFCKECVDTERVGKPFYTVTDKDGKLHVHGSKLKKCNYCGKTWRSERPTLKEAFGYDGENQTPF